MFNLLKKMVFTITGFCEINSGYRNDLEPFIIYSLKVVILCFKFLLKMNKKFKYISTFRKLSNVVISVFSFHFIKIDFIDIFFFFRMSASGSKGPAPTVEQIQEDVITQVL